MDSVNQKTFRDYEIYIHPEWNSTTQAGNVALIKLSTVVEYTRMLLIILNHLNCNIKSILIVVNLTEYIRPICLPSSSEPDYINQQVIVTGAYNASVSYDESNMN